MFIDDAGKTKENKGKISPGDVMKVLNFLGVKPSKAEVNLFIWVILKTIVF
jgi:Ca2+-binding EF-hand superfamily protein